MNELAVVKNVNDFGVVSAGKAVCIEKRYLNVGEISVYLGMGKPTIYRYAEERKIPCFKIGKILRFDIHEIEKWLKGFKREPIS